MTRRRNVQRGTTLIEILISMAVVVVGMLGLYKAIGSATQGSMLANRFTQAQARAQQVVEAMRKSPPGTPPPALDCLARLGTGGSTAAWANCEVKCLQTYNANFPSNTQSCIFSSLDAVTPAGPGPVFGQAADKAQQQYAVVFDTTSPVATQQRSSWVKPVLNCLSQPCTLYDVQVTVGWNDDGSTQSVATLNPPKPDHRVTVHQVIMQ